MSTTTTTTLNNQRLFQYKFKKDNDNSHISIHLEIPTRIAVAEHVAILMQQYRIPIYLKYNLEEKLKEFFKHETQAYLDNTLDFCVETCVGGDGNGNDDLTKYWHDKLKQTKIENENLHDLDDLKFTKIYHDLIHSECMSVILNKERDYMIECNDLIIQRDKNLSYLELLQQTKLNDALKMNSTNEQSVPDNYITRLANEHSEVNELEKSKWDSKIMNLKENQKLEFKLWLYELYSNDEFKRNQLNAYLEQQQQQIQSNQQGGEHVTHLEESYTIQLGAQLKTTHNLRLIKCDILDYCRSRFNLRFNLIEPHTILNSLSLYSNNLCACVLLVDRNLRKTNGIQEKFIKICEESTEFHFQSYEQQLNRIENCLVGINKQVSPHTGQDDMDLCQLSSGDFYITKHSNLSQVNLIFNLACDEDFYKQKSDLSSRHPLILGLRNILKACCRYDIKTITLPLLLTHKMCEEMTINWVLKRTELVLKCLKGFMIEFVQWGSLESRTLQFVVPHDLEDETFHSLSNLIKTIFRESRTVNLS